MQDTGTVQQLTDAFYGYHHADTVGNGEWYDEKNISGREFPALATRLPRTEVTTLTAPMGMVERDTLVYVDGSSIKYGNQTIDLGLSDGEKQLVSMGAYLLIWPDKKYINTSNLSDRGSMEQSNTVSETVGLYLCRSTGDIYTNVTISATPPSNPAAGTMWMDTGADTPTLKEYDGSMGTWQSVTTTYIKITASNIGTGFSRFDGVTLSGFTGNLAYLNGPHVLQDVGTGYLLFSGTMTATETSFAGGIGVGRTVPDMDYVTECGNRIWGCKYGTVDGASVNEIYACKLGDFRNWNCFAGLSTDSYTASRGSDGPWTGAVTYGGHPLFFKERYLEKVFPSATGAHQIATDEVPGVQRGSWRSIKTVGGVLYYKGTDGVYAYTGSIPQKISDALGDVLYQDARAGAIGDVYYISMQNRGTLEWSLFTYDTAKRLWHKEDAVKALCFASDSNTIYYIDETTKKVVDALGRSGTSTETVEWMVETGMIGRVNTRNKYRQDPEAKYISRMVLRMDLNGSLNVYVNIDNEGWMQYGSGVCSRGLKSVVVPIFPRRADTVRLRLVGKGNCRIFSILKYYEKGSDVF